MVPLLVAVIHTAAASDDGLSCGNGGCVSYQIYGLFGLCRLWLITGIVTMIYMIVYKITAKAYYKFVY